MAKSLAFGITINGVGLGEKELAKIEKGAIKSKKAIDDLTLAWKDGGKTMENIAAKQSHIAAAERKLRQDEKTQIRETERVKRDEIKKTTKENKEAAQALKSQKKAALEDDAKEKRSIEGLRLIVRDLRKEYNQLSEAQLGSSGGKARLKQLQDEEALLQKRERAYGLASRNVGNYPIGGQIASNLTGGLIGNGLGAGLVAGAGAAALAVKELIQFNIEIDSLQANVRKTTGLNTESVERLTDRLASIQTTTSIENLLKIAEGAGRLGVQGEKGIGDFTEAIDILNVSLGDEFGGGVEEITERLSSLSTLFYGLTEDGSVLAEEFLHIGNAINALASSSNSTADGISDIAQRIAGTSKTFGFTEGQILGISAAIESMGINAEKGAGGFNTLNKRIRANVADISASIGIGQKELTKLLDTKPYEAMTLVIQKLFAQSKGSQTELAGILKDLKLSGDGVSDIIFNFARQQALLNKEIAIGEEQIISTSSVVDEYGNQMESVAAKLSLLGNSIRNAFISDTGQSFLGRVIDDIRLLGNSGNHVDNLKRIAYLFSNVATGGLAGFSDRAGEFRADQLKTDQQRKSEREAREATTRAIQNRISGIIGGKTGIEQYTNVKAPNILEFITSDTKGLTKEQQDEIKRQAKEAARIAKQEAERLEKERIAKGDAGSVSFITKEISDLKQLMDRTASSKLLERYNVQLKELNRQLIAAQNRIKLLGKDTNISVNSDGTVTDSTPIDINGSSDFNEKILKEQEKFNEEQKKLREKSKKDRDDEEKDAIEHKTKSDSKILDLEVKSEIDKINAAREANDKLEEQQEQARDIYFSAAQQTVDGLFEIWNNYEDRKTENALNKIDAEYDARLAAVKGNATLEEALLREMEEKKEEIEKKAAKKRQQRAIIQANIDIAAAVISAATTQPFIPVGLAATIAAAALGAVQLGVIKSQKFASGGFTPNVNGMPDETGHVPVGAVHDGEWVANKKFVSNNRPLFRYLENIQSNTYRPFASGGFASSDIRVPQIFNSVAEAQGGAGFSMDQLEMALERAVERGAYKGTYFGGDDKERKAEQRNIAITNSVR